MRGAGLWLSIVLAGCSVEESARPGVDAGSDATGGAGGTGGAAGSSGDAGSGGALDSGCTQNCTLVPDTTLAQETGNNTSGVKGTFNGNAEPGNVSHVPTRSLLYPGSTSRIFAHFMPWFGEGDHADVGYASNDPAQVAKQIEDMQARGIEGVIIDWYGPDFQLENQTALAIMAAAETHGFLFAIMEDGGAVKWCNCDPTPKVTADLTYAYETFETSPAYYRIDSRPVVFFFDMSAQPVDLVQVRAAIADNPLFIERNAGSFDEPQYDGAYSWVEIAADPADWGKSYLDDYYASALAHPGKPSLGSAYKGFDDTLAAWSADRHVNQDCGQTWLRTFAELDGYYSSSQPLLAIQLVTWNDYEEGTEIETGIDNCVSLTASVTGDALEWTLSGDDSTLDHFELFVSNDGVNLMRLATDIAPTSRAFDLSGSTLVPGDYSLFVKAVGKPSILNHMSPPAAWKR